MTNQLAQLSAIARNAAHGQDWVSVHACATRILKLDRNNAEGYFLSGLVCKANGQGDAACDAFSTCLQLQPERYDAAIELANLYCLARRNGEAYALLEQYCEQLQQSPMYLNMAGSIYSGIGLPEKAWPLYKQANELQPDVDLILANIATCGVFLGKIEESRQLYERLLKRHPSHQRYHYQLARLLPASSWRHIEHMKQVVLGNALPDEKNVFIFYAIAKELEDLEQWDEAFHYYKRAGDAVSSVADYDINTDLTLMQTFIEQCDANWLAERSYSVQANTVDKVPVFVVGLPRTGTTLIERIIASHSQVQSVGETQFMQMTIRHLSEVESEEKITPEMIRRTAQLDIRAVRDGYRQRLDYRLGKQPLFIDKLPFNIFYLGFIAKAFPEAKLVHVRRNPMDSCFAMYKQVFTWAYKFSYTLDGLAQFYPAYEKLVNHWYQLLGERIITIDYEDIVYRQEEKTRELLDKLELPFEAACLCFEKNATATYTASAVQVREKVHTRSVGRWKHYEKHLLDLRKRLLSAGVDA